MEKFEDILEDLEPILFLHSSAQSTPPLFNLEIANEKERIAFVSKKSVSEPERAGSPASRPKSDGESQVGEFLAGRNETPSFYETKAVLEAISKSKIPLSVDKISELTHLSPQAVNSELGELMINHIIEEDGLGYKIMEK